jgi:hypothetical protein
VGKTTGKRTSLGTTNEDEARHIVGAKNNSERQPVLTLQIAKAYLPIDAKGNEGLPLVTFCSFFKPT